MFTLLAPALLLASLAQAEPSWHQFRGPLGTGVAPAADPPIEWSESHNLRWKALLPGKGHSTPIISGDLVVLTTAVPFGDAVEPRFDQAPGAHDGLAVTQEHRFVALAISRDSGELVWERVLHEGFPREGGHDTASYASDTPVTDGERVVVSFGSRGVFGLDLDGNIFWSVELEPANTKHAHGEGSSPVMFDGTVVLVRDHEDDSYVLALDAESGEERWRVDRNEPTSWATPIVVQDGERNLVVVSGTGRVRAYDLADGEIVWECGGLSHNVVASPVAADGVVYAGSSYEKQALLAIRFEGARGNLTETDRLLWVRRRATPYVPSLLLYEEALYFLHHYQGFLARVDAKSGKEAGRPLRLEGMSNVYASPLGAGGRVYIVDRSGRTAVVSHDSEPRVLALNDLEDSFSASPVAVGRELFLRGEQALYCIAESQAEVQDGEKR